MMLFLRRRILETQFKVTFYDFNTTDARLASNSHSNNNKTGLFTWIAISVIILAISIAFVIHENILVLLLLL